MSKLTRGWVDYLRSNARQERRRAGDTHKDKDIICVGCGENIHNSLEAFKSHARGDASKHPWKTDTEMDEAYMRSAEPQAQ